MRRQTETVARALCPKRTPCDRCKSTAEAIVTDPTPLLTALVEVGALDRVVPSQTRANEMRHLYATRWQERT